MHNHILPGIDDGAANLEESLNLIRKFYSLGVKNFIATPHIMNDYYPNTPQTINNALNEVTQALSSEPELKDVQISAAAEYMMDQTFLDLFQAEELLCLKDNYVLVEMSYFQAPINLQEILFQLQTKGYRPVLAHPERYAFFHSKDLAKYSDLKSRGCLMQANALSFSGHYGSRMQETVFRLLENEMIDFISSDAHREQHLEKLEKVTLQQKHLPHIQKAVDKTRQTFGH